MANFQQQLVYKVYSEDDTFISVLTDVVSDFSIHRQCNGGDGEFTIILNRKIDDFSEDVEIKFNNRVKVYLQNEHNPLGDKLIGYGYITSYKPYLRGKEERVEVTCLSAVSKLKNDFFRLGTSSTSVDIAVELTSKRADEMFEAVIDHYRSVESNSMISNDYSNVDATPDNTGGAISFDYRFFNMRHLDAMREISKFLPRNKSGGYFFYWRISTDGKLWVKNISTTADHTFIIGKHITEIEGYKTIEGVINRTLFWNEKGTVDPDFVRLTSEDVSSQNDYDIISSYITDSKITNAAAASLLASSRIYDNKDPKVQIKISLNGEYDLASIVPGQTCQILNAKNNPFKVGSDTVLFIHSVDYEVDTATIEVSNAQERFEDMVDEERIRLDQEMRWYGRITQALTAAQLAPANRAWTTTITFSATTGADAYRQIDWTAGTIYIPAGESGSSAKRIVDIGNTGLMAPGSTYYIYLDEELLPTTAAVVTRTGTSKQGGDTLTDDGSPGWSNDQYKGYVVEIGGQKKIIKSNTASILTLEDRWTVADQTSQTYTISKLALSATTSEETAMADTRIVFTNAAANTNTASDAILAPATNTDLIIDGETQIAQHSIVAANLITTEVLIANSAQIDNAVIQDAHITGTITVSHTDAKCTDPNADQTSVNTADDTSYVNGTAASTVATGANRGYNGLNASYQIVKGFLDSHLSEVTLPADGVRIDSNGIYGRASSVTTFYISNAGSAYFRGQIAATSGYIGGTSDGWVITSGYIKSTSGDIELKGTATSHIKAIDGTDYVQMTSSGGPRIDVIGGGYIRTRLNKDGLYFYDTSGTQKARIYGSGTANEDLYISASFVNISGRLYAKERVYVSNELYVSSEAGFEGHIYPLTLNTYFCGTAGSYWARVYSDAYFTKNTTWQTGWDKYNDLQIIRNLKTIKDDTKKSGYRLDASGLPKEIYDKGFTDFGGLISFNLCASKKIVECIDDLREQIHMLTSNLKKLEEK